MAFPVQLNQTLEMVRGDTAEWLFHVVDASGGNVNLSGASALFTAKYRTSDVDASAVFQLSQASGITIDSGATGTGTIKVLPVQTVGVPDVKTKLVFDFQVLISANKYTPSRGTLIVYPDVTLS